jgi:hypothetical protein
MAVYNLDFIGMPIIPPETNTPPFIDANAMLSHAIALQSLKPVSTDSLQIIQVRCGMKPFKSFSRSPLDAWKFPAAETIMQRFGFRTSK